MSLQPSQNDALHLSSQQGIYPNGQVNGSRTFRTRSPHSERSKHQVREIADNAAHLDEQSSVQLKGRVSIDSLSGLSDTHHHEGNKRNDRSLLQSIRMGESIRHSSRKRSSWRVRLDVFWKRNKGVLMVLLAELFGAFMTTATRLLETGVDGSGAGMEPFQVCQIHKEAS